MWIMSMMNSHAVWSFEASDLAIPAAQAIAAHGIVGKSALLAAVGSTPCTLLQFRVIG